MENERECVWRRTILLDMVSSFPAVLVFRSAKPGCWSSRVALLDLLSLSEVCYLELLIALVTLQFFLGLFCHSIYIVIVYLIKKKEESLMY
jgi:hypothetical protein